MKIDKYSVIGILCAVGSAAFGLLGSANNEKKREEKDKKYLEELYENDKKDREGES